MSHQTHGNLIKRIAITVALGVAFIVMASIFRPERSTAGNNQRRQRPAPKAVPTSEPAQPSLNASDGLALLSADAHAGLRSLGVIETGRYLVAIFATDLGPRYTIFDAQSQHELGTLLSAEQLSQLLPEVDLTSVDFSVPTDQQPLMLAEPREP
jgi:hypothetical protein